MQNDDRFDVLTVERPALAAGQVTTCTWRTERTMLFHRLVLLADDQATLYIAGESLCELTIGRRQLGMGLALSDLSSPVWLDRYIPRTARVMTIGEPMTLAIHGSRALLQSAELSILVVGRLPPSCCAPAA